jgi:hypothetical protein
LNDSSWCFAFVRLLVSWVGPFYYRARVGRDDDWLRFARDVLDKNSHERRAERKRIEQRTKAVKTRGIKEGGSSVEFVFIEVFPITVCD